MSDQEFDFDRIAAALGVDRATLPPDKVEQVERRRLVPCRLLPSASVTMSGRSSKR